MGIGQTDKLTLFLALTDTGQRTYKLDHTFYWYTRSELGKYQIFNTQEYWGEYLSIDIESMCDTK